jgi:hypothetical protein
MSAEIIAERTLDLPVGPVRFTLARHDDGHYSGVAAIVATGRRIGLLTHEPASPRHDEHQQTLVDPALAGVEVVDELLRLLAVSRPSIAPAD